MKIFQRFYKISFFILCLVILIFSLSGCSQNLPEIYNSDYYVVFTYKDYESEPVVRLSIFVESSTDARRCDRIELRSMKNDYVWNTKNIDKFISADRQWAGNVNFVVPNNEKIPTGRYEVKYVTADENEKKSYINVKYDEKLYDSNAEAAGKIMSHIGSKNIAIYDENRALLYLGERTEELSTKGDIFNTYNEAVYYQDIWISYDNSLVCILPEDTL